MAENLSKKLFFFVIIFSPLAFGTVEPWSYAVMEISVLLSLFLYLIYNYKSSEHIYLIPGIVPLILFLAYILMQIIPLPPQIIKFISHQSHDLQNLSSNMTISVHPRATLLEFFRYSTYVAFYVLAVQLLSDKKLLKKTIFMIAIFGVILAFSSILQLYLTDSMALWIRHINIKRNSLMGPYINRNHYAGLMEMIFPLVLALFLFHKPRNEDLGFLKSIVEIFKQEKANIHILIGTGALLIVTSIFVSLSRGGMISTCAGLIFFLVLSYKKKASKKNSILILCMILFTSLSMGWFGWGQVYDRFSELQTPEGTIYHGRIDYWKDSKKIVADFPAVGSGFGTFVDIYRSYQTVDSNILLEHAHNDYIELISEGGVIGVLLIFSFLITLFYKTYHVFSLRKDAYSIYIYIGAMAGIISILVHSITDFNLHVGANGLWFALLAAIAVSAANTRLKAKNIKTNLLPVKSEKIKPGLLATVSFLFLIVLVSNISILISNFYHTNVNNSTFDFNTSPEELKKIQKITKYASFFDPLNSNYIHSIANISWFLDNNKEAKDAYLKSIRLNSANGNHHKRFALFLSRTGDIIEAEKVLEKSIALDISNSDNALQYGGLLLATGQRKKGVKFLKKAISLDPQTIGSVLTTMIASGLTLDEMERAIPKDINTAIIYTQFLDQIGEIEKAQQRYLDIVSSFGTHKDITFRNIDTIYKFFKNQGNFYQAMEVLKQGEKVLPKNASIRIRLGDIYINQGIIFKAKEKYKEALILKPENKKIKIKLDKLNQ